MVDPKSTEIKAFTLVLVMVPASAQVSTFQRPNNLWTNTEYLLFPGMKFALTQLKAAMVEIVRNFDFKVNRKTRTDNQLDDTYFMAALKGGIWLDFRELK